MLFDLYFFTRTFYLVFFSKNKKTFEILLFSGVNEKFLVSTGSHLALLYDNVSVLENHHWRSAISCFVDAGMTKYLSAEGQFLEFTELVRSLVLATDISRQQEFLTQLRFFLDNNQLNLSFQHHRHFILQIAIKCADISNPCRDWAVSKLWSLRACEEFFRQGDVERELGFELTPICDRFNVTVAKVQVGFYSFVVEPLFIEWHRFLANDFSEEMLRCFRQNQTKWEEEVMQEELPSSTASDSASKPIAQMDANVLSADGCARLEPGKNMSMSVASSLAPSSAADLHPKLGRRMSLPCNDPLLRVFDQMTQPDADFTTKAVNLRRNFSLTDRRRSSLLRGLFNRSSLKPGRGKICRPTSVSISTGSGGDVPTTGNDAGSGTKRSQRSALQSRETRFRSPVSVQFSEDVLSENTTPIYPPTFEDEDECVIKMDQKENTVNSSVLLTPCQQLSLDERLTRRRGSAPCNLILAETKISTALLRHEQNCLNATVRRGSLPSELIKESLPKQLRNRVLNQNAVASAAAANNNKAKAGLLLRRRSMGAELLNLHQHQLHHQQPHYIHHHQGQGAVGPPRDRQKYKNRPI